MQHVSLYLCSLVAATSQFSVFIGQKMQLTGYENANNMRNVTCAATQTSNAWPYCSFPYTGRDLPDMNIFCDWLSETLVINVYDWFFRNYVSIVLSSFNVLSSQSQCLFI